MEMYRQLESVETARVAVTVVGQGEREPVRRAPLGRLLVDAGLATRDEVQRAAEEAARNDERFGEVLLRHGSVEERDLARLLAEQWDVPFVESPIVAPSARGLLSLAEARTVEALPLSFESGRALVAVTDPSAERFGQVRSLLGRIAADFVVVTPTELERRSEKPIENLRPQHLFEALFPSAPATGPRAQAFLEENEFSGRRYYAVTEIVEAEGAWRPARRWWFDRTDLALVRVQSFDAEGRLLADIHYGQWQETDGIPYPRTIELVRPQEDYRLKLIVKKLTLNQPLPPERFRLEPPAGVETVELKSASADKPDSGKEPR